MRIHQHHNPEVLDRRGFDLERSVTFNLSLCFSSMQKQSQGVSKLALKPSEEMATKGVLRLARR